MRLDHPFLHKLGGLLGSAAIRAWMRTIDSKGAFYDPTIDPNYSACERPRIYIFWHEYILYPLSLRGHANMAMLLSRHRDGEILSHVAHHIGFEFIRGSSNRGGVAALRELLARGRRRHLAITPDGPRGPRRQMAGGPIYLASRLNMPLILMAFGYDRPWRINSWDRFAIPRPFSRCRVILTPEISVPADLDRDGLEHFRQKVELLLNQLGDRAEAWAISGRRKPEQIPLFPCPAPPLIRPCLGEVF